MGCCWQPTENRHSSRTKEWHARRTVVTVKKETTTKQAQQRATRDCTKRGLIFEHCYFPFFVLPPAVMQASATSFFVRILEPSERQAARGNSRQPGAKVQRNHCRSPSGHKDRSAHNTASLRLRRSRVPREKRLSSMAAPLGTNAGEALRKLAEAVDGTVLR